MPSLRDLTYDRSKAGADDWELHWEHFAEHASENPAQDYRHRTVLRLLEQLELRNDVRLLDLGSGQGDFLAKAATAWPNADLAGVELSEQAVLMTTRKVPRARVFEANLFAPRPELKVLEAWAHVVVCCEVLEHVDDPATLLRAARCYCTPGARLIVTVPGGPMSSFDRHIGHRQHFTARKLRSYLGASGWEVQRIFRAGFPFFNIYRALVIARGERLARDLTSTPTQILRLERIAMHVFRVLFRANFLDSPFGWQIIAIARKS